jgi:hypothetical protein
MASISIIIQIIRVQKFRTRSPSFTPMCVLLVPIVVIISRRKNIRVVCPTAGTLIDTISRYLRVIQVLMPRLLNARNGKHAHKEEHALRPCPDYSEAFDILPSHQPVYSTRVLGRV